MAQGRILGCKGCAERREKIVATANRCIEWIKNPRGPAPFNDLIGGNPKPPLTPRPPVVKNK